MTHKIAIITTREFYTGDYGDEYNKVVDSITDWEEVTHDEYIALSSAAPRLGFHLIEQPTDTRAFVARTVADYLVFAKAEAIREEAEKQKRADAALERKFKKDLKDKASKEKMLEKLAAELGVDLTGFPTVHLPK
jgi:hypothetical protein